MTVFLLQLLSTFMMTGIIWFIQVVHYPLLAKETDYEKNTVRTGFVVVPLMVVEAVTAIWLLFIPSLWGTAFLIAALLLLLIWLSTFCIQVPLHHRKKGGLLILTNWIRTIAWTARTLILLRIALLASSL